MQFILAGMLISMMLVFAVMFVVTTPYRQGPRMRPARPGRFALGTRSAEYPRLFDQVVEGVIALSQPSRDGSVTYLPQQVVVSAHPEDAALLGAYRMQLTDELNRYFAERSGPQRWELRGTLRLDIEPTDTMPQSKLWVRHRERVQLPAPTPNSRIGANGDALPLPCLSPVRGVGVPILRVGPKGGRIGRDTACDLVIGVPTVSTHHATIHPVDAGGWEIIDVQSRNGTFVNDEPINRALLREGDEIGFGPDVIMRWSAVGHVAVRTMPGSSSPGATPHAS